MSVKTYISINDLSGFLNALSQAFQVFVPQHNGAGYSFELHDPLKPLCLDYDVTILPPRKIFSPPRQTMFSFNGQHFQEVIDRAPALLFAVHPYDVLAIEQTDHMFSENYPDIYYLAKREASLIVQMPPLNAAPRAFWQGMNSNQSPRAQDALLSILPETYVLSLLSEKSLQLMGFPQARPASADEIQQAIDFQNAAHARCTHQMPLDVADFQPALRESFSRHEFWEKHAADCFSCGACNVVCPTCYCFNIEDQWHSDQVSGERVRYWDACMTRQFAEITIAEGKKENFRRTAGARMRHRIMRKLVYLNEKLGTTACVGCGRCASACTVDIADPVNIVSDLLLGDQHV